MIVFRSELESNAFNFLSRLQLVKLKRRAMRSGAWFRRLLRIDRALIDLTIRAVCNVRSASLAESILSVTRKVEGCFESKFVRAVRESGFLLVCKPSLFAQRWGNIAAKSWFFDLYFAKFLAIMNLNEPKMFEA